MHPRDDELYMLNDQGRAMTQKDNLNTDNTVSAARCKSSKLCTDQVIDTAHWKY